MGALGIHAWGRERGTESDLGRGAKTSREAISGAALASPQGLWS